MLSQYFDTPLSLGIARVVIAFFFSFFVILLARWQKIHLEKEILVSLIRGLLQVISAGLVLVILFKGPFYLGSIILIGMMIAAASIASRRTKGINGAFKTCLISIISGAGSVIMLMTFLGVIEWKLTSLIPVGSMIIAGGMNASTLVLDRIKSEILSHVGQIETALALGATPQTASQPYLKSSFRASLLPTMNSIRSLGIVWIPGLMAGMLIAGESPVNAALYQFVVMGMIFISVSLCSLICSLLIRKEIFSKAQQLVLRPENQ